MLAQVAVDPQSTVPILGASGAIAAVMGAFLVTYPRDRIRTLLLFLFPFYVRVTSMRAWFLIGFWLLIQLVSIGGVSKARTGGVAYFAHVGGAIFGAVTARLFEDPERLSKAGEDKPP